MALGSIVMTKLTVDSGVPPLIAILLGVATCMVVGFVNGGLVVGLMVGGYGAGSAILGPLATRLSAISVSHAAIT